MYKIVKETGVELEKSLPREMQSTKAKTPKNSSFEESILNSV